MDNITGIIQRNRIEQISGTLTPKTFNIAGTLNAMRTFPIVRTQEKTVVSSLKKQEVTPDTDYSLSKVTVEELPITRVLNEQGGYTITIGGN